MEIVSNCCGAKVDGLNADNIGRCLECGEGCGVDVVSSHCVKHNKSICKECQKDGLWDFGVAGKEGCGVEDVKEDLETVMRKILGDDFESFLDNLTERLKMSKEIKKNLGEGCGVEEEQDELHIIYQVKRSDENLRDILQNGSERHYSRDRPKKDLEERLADLCVKAYMLGCEHVVVDLPSLVSFIKKELAQAKTEAKIEVLEEVLGNVDKLSVRELRQLEKLAVITGSSWHYSSLVILKEKLEKMLSNLKKKKK